MKTIRRADERGAGHHGWLEAKHTFSFNTYLDPDHMEFRSLRVMNEDRVAPGKGFPTHPHDNMEILTYVVSGALEHRDSMGNGSIIHAGEMQKMSAGTGVTHSEFNPSDTEPTHLYQIWIRPAVRGIAPSYAERDTPFQRDAWNLVAAPEGQAEGEVFPIAQDAKVFLGKLGAGLELDYSAVESRYLWLQVVTGEVRVDGEVLSAGDGLNVAGESGITVSAVSDADVILFDLA